MEGQLMRATKMRDLDGFTGDTALYQLSEEYLVRPGLSVRHVVVSCVEILGQDTYLFPANAAGEVLSWVELPGSFSGGLDHNVAIGLFESRASEPGTVRDLRAALAEQEARIMGAAAILAEAKHERDMQEDTLHGAIVDALDALLAFEREAS
jgi:hypothetical protein